VAKGSSGDGVESIMKKLKLDPLSLLADLGCCAERPTIKKNDSPTTVKTPREAGAKIGDPVLKLENPRPAGRHHW
jgi:hypothetical protein